MMINTTTVVPTVNNALVETVTPLIVAMKTLGVASVTISSDDLTAGQVKVFYTNTPSQQIDPSITNNVNALLMLVVRQIAQKLNITEDFCGIVITINVDDKSASVEYRIIRETTRFTFSGVRAPETPADDTEETPVSGDTDTPSDVEDAAVESPAAE